MRIFKPIFHNEACCFRGHHQARALRRMTRLYKENRKYWCFKQVVTKQGIGTSSGGA
jgi:hypothetical protein